MKRLYFRKIRDGIAIEGRSANSKPVLIYTLGTAEKHLNKLLDCACFFTKEKETQIRANLARVASVKEKTNKQSPKVRSILINRTPIKDADSSEETSIGNDEERLSFRVDPSSEEKKKVLSEEEKRLLWEITKE